MWSLLLHLTAATAAPPVVDVLRMDDVAVDALGVSTRPSQQIIHLALRRRGQEIELSCVTSEPPGPTCTAVMPDGRARTYRTAALRTDDAGRFAMQPAVWIGGARQVGPVPAADLGQRLALADLGAGNGWTTDALVGDCVVDDRGVPLEPPDELARQGAKAVRSEVVAAWRCSALDGGALTGALERAPAAAIPWLTEARGRCEGGAVERLGPALCEAWAAAPEAAVWCGRAAPAPAPVADDAPVGAPVGVTDGFPASSAAVGGVAKPGEVRVVHHSVINWKQRTPIAAPSASGDPVRCRVAVELDASGTPVKAEASDCPRPYAAAAEAAVRTWRAYPVKVDGVAVRVRVALMVGFEAAEP